MSWLKRGMPSRSKISSSAFCGTSSTDDFSTALLYEPFLRLPAKPNIFILSGKSSPDLDLIDCNFIIVDEPIKNWSNLDESGGSMMPNIDPRTMKNMMSKMGIKSEEIDASRVVIETPEKDIIIEDPQVTRIEMQGTTSFQISGNVTEVEKSAEVKVTDSDIDFVSERTGINDREKIRRALEKERRGHSEGDTQPHWGCRAPSHFTLNACAYGTLFIVFMWPFSIIELLIATSTDLLPTTFAENIVLRDLSSPSPALR